jgi:hypothetical protein
MRRGNPGLLRVIADNDSVTGTAAAILLRNIRPKRLSNGDYRIALSEFTANFHMNCDGFKVRPKVVVSVMCNLSALQQQHIKNKKRMDAALRNSPILK